MLRKRAKKQTRTDVITIPDGNEECTSREQAEQITTGSTARQHPYLETMIGNTSDAMIALDEHFHVLELNQAAVKALGCSDQKAIGQKCSDILRCQNLNRMDLCGTSSCPLVRVLQQKRPLPNEDLIIGESAEHECEVSTSVVPIEVGDSCYVVFTARDLSALKVANQVRSNFVSMVSHELRTPLNSVHGFIDLLLQGHMGELNEEQRMYLGYTQEGVLQLIPIVEDILFMTRSDIGQFEIKQQEVPLQVLGKQVISSMKPQALKASVVLDADIPPNTPSLYIDPQRIKQVLNNLIANAIDAMRQGGRLVVRAHEATQPSTGRRGVRMTIADTGHGMPEAVRRRLFQPFYTTKGLNGTGLGLWISEGIVKRHQGRMEVRSCQHPVHHGTVFTLFLPFEEQGKQGMAA